ncbi:hypothetical protein [Adhaeribacter pallidiroseus]|uniref:Uncharacterized protein n=1 Tax=Adhaeribacter pallidiroseus TaxID=2072847 RepID=A0A369Q6Z3_9BACT|nr:hypothetical protein [Adhaeribacter pallidiroseus]RDC58689.1 hypothetical protein AHMF7616_05323 [Adhaeribacter pallidiroseus]
MKHLVTLLLLVFFFENTTLAQSALVEVADLSVKVPGMGSKEYYYGFEAGDELVFDFVDLSKKGLKQVEIIEYPNQTKYAGLQVSTFTKSLKINKRGIYLFRFTNNALAQRACTVKINRKPASSSTINFNTQVTWKEVTDTTFTTVTKQELTRYDTTFTYYTKKELVKVDTLAQELFSRVEQVAAETTIGKPSESVIQINLPQNKTAPLESTELISWAYWLGVGQEGHLAFEANKKAYVQALGSLANVTGHPLIGLALNQVAFLPTGNAGSNVEYYFMADRANATIFMNSFDKGGFRYYDHGNGISGYGRKEAPTQGTFYLGLHNDNFHNDINVTVKVVTVVLRRKYELKQYKQPTVTPRYESKIVKQPLVTIKKVPVIT